MGGRLTSHDSKKKGSYCKVIQKVLHKLHSQIWELRIIQRNAAIMVDTIAMGFWGGFRSSILSYNLQVQDGNCAEKNRLKQELR